MAGRKGKGKIAIGITAAVVILLTIVSFVMEKTGAWQELYSRADLLPEKQTELVSEETVPPLTAYFIDVGQGDCALFVCGDEVLLVDSGEAKYAHTVLATLKELKITELDYVVATHGHSDHIGSMAEVMSQTETKCIIMPEYSTSTSATYERFLDAADESGAEIIVAEVGGTFSLGAARCEILAPVKAYSSNENNNSVVLYITYGETSFLLMGDAEKESEEAILANSPSLTADILKVGHHGSVTSSSVEFINQICPETAIISVGEGNSYGHPGEEILQRLSAVNTHCFRTDERGRVTITCTLDTYTIDTEK